MKIKTVDAGAKTKGEVFKMLDELKNGEMLSISFSGDEKSEEEIEYE